MALRVDDHQLASVIGYRNLDGTGMSLEPELELDMISLRRGFCFCRAQRRNLETRSLADRSK